MKIKEFYLYSEAAEKLESLLAENNLVFTFHRQAYPIYMTVSPDTDVSAQMELYTTGEDDVSARDAKLSFIFQDGDIIVRTDSRLIIPDALMSKIKGFAKKMHYLYLQAYFRESMERAGAEKGNTSQE